MLINSTENVILNISIIKKPASYPEPGSIVLSFLTLHNLYVYARHLFSIQFLALSNYKNCKVYYSFCFVENFYYALISSYIMKDAEKDNNLFFLSLFSPYNTLAMIAQCGANAATGSTGFDPFAGFSVTFKQGSAAVKKLLRNEPGAFGPQSFHIISNVLVVVTPFERFSE